MITVALIEANSQIQHTEQFESAEYLSEYAVFRRPKNTVRIPWSNIAWVMEDA